MRVGLLDPERDFEWEAALAAAAVRQAEREGRPVRDRGPARRADLPWNAEALAADLGLRPLVDAMAGPDDAIFEVAWRVLLAGVSGDAETIRYRQEVLRDALAQRTLVRALYAVAVEATAQLRRPYFGSYVTRYPEPVLRSSIETLEALLGWLERLRSLLVSGGAELAAAGWRRLVSTVTLELSPEYLARIRGHLAELRFRQGVRVSAGLGDANQGAGYRLHPPPAAEKKGLLDSLRASLSRRSRRPPPAYRITIHPRDEAGARDLGELRARGVAIAAEALRRAAEQVRCFFGALRAEVAFYVGAVNLHERLSALGSPVGWPVPLPAGQKGLVCRGLYDPVLALALGRPPVGSDVSGAGKDLIVVTGANQGGKSTFLRSVGLAHLMTQSGMFAPAAALQAPVAQGLFTHFRREEDRALRSGKLDEELARMSEIVDHLTPASLILFNESFSATNEREGSEIARQIVTALLERGIRMVFVTHLYEFAAGLAGERRENALFLRADRRPDGSRTFELLEGEPLGTSHGTDLFAAIIGGWPDDPIPAGAGPP